MANMIDFITADKKRRAVAITALSYPRTEAIGFLRDSHRLTLKDASVYLSKIRKADKNGELYFGWWVTILDKDGKARVGYWSGLPSYGLSPIFGFCDTYNAVILKKRPVQ